MPCSLVCDRGCVRGRGDHDGEISTCERDGHREGKRHDLRRRLRWPDRCPHGTAARHPPLLCHCRGMEREGGMETTLHTCRGRTARHRPTRRVECDRRRAVLGWARRVAGRRGSRRTDSSVSRECAMECASACEDTRQCAPTLYGFAWNRGCACGDVILEPGILRTVGVLNITVSGDPPHALNRACASRGRHCPPSRACASPSRACASFACACPG